jgi:hypothetical protein
MTTLEDLKQQVEDLTDKGHYEAAADLAAESLQIRMEVLSSRFSSMPWDKDGQKRYIFTIRLINAIKKYYEFEFGQSVAQGNEEPTMYDILTCITKYNPGSFEDFCGDFGYDEDSRSAEKTYKAVVKEYKAMCKLFTQEELEVLQLIN